MAGQSHVKLGQVEEGGISCYGIDIIVKPSGNIGGGKLDTTKIDTWSDPDYPKRLEVVRKKIPNTLMVYP
jgi:hypothetical protein